MQWLLWIFLAITILFSVLTIRAVYQKKKSLSKTDGECALKLAASRGQYTGIGDGPAMQRSDF